MELDWAACVGVLVIDYHQPMREAWDLTYREYCLLVDVKHKLRGVEARKHYYDQDKTADLEAHLRSIGALT